MTVNLKAGFIEQFSQSVRGRTFTRAEADEMIDRINLCAPPRPDAPKRVFVISYDTNTGITEQDKAAAEKLLGKVVWFQTNSGSRPPQITMFSKESE